NWFNMAADSSSSDDEELKKCREAVWDTQIHKAKGEYLFSHFCVNKKMNYSCSLVVAGHDHDGNELQVTQGFQKHVAKKLGHYLDRYSDFCCFRFRLFSTSIPGQKVTEPPPTVRRRPIPSSSDSDSEMEMRLKEAAVSVEDLVAASALLSSLTEPVGLEKIKKNAPVFESVFFTAVAQASKLRGRHAPLETLCPKKNKGHPKDLTAAQLCKYKTIYHL
uniref:Protein CUSTOS n=1 Tax=Oryzias latipes TaxID=8090 RepID=A0A3P9HY55_ORYLA